jgi:CheY-like chemotaxis protein
MQTDWAERPRGRTVLVVDDELPLRIVVARTLRQAGYRAWVAANPAAALIMLASAPTKPDLILSDVHMPGMNGVDFAIELRRCWAELPVVLMSSREPAGLPQGLTAAFLPKPFGAEALLRVMDLALNQDKRRSA